jgi:aconitate hydratase
MRLIKQQTCSKLLFPDGQLRAFYSLPILADLGFEQVTRLPISLRVILESLLRSYDGVVVNDDHIESLVNWQPNAERNTEIPFFVARVLLQDFTGVPVLCDLAALRDAAVRLGLPATAVEPRLPLDLVIDHSVQIDHYGDPTALFKNMENEFVRNEERYRFIKWGRQAFKNLTVVPPGTGIVHQVNLEQLAPPLHERDGVCFPDSLVGTDSHTTMINSLGVVGWGVGGIEAEAAMLGQPINLLTPDVVGVYLHGQLDEGVCATDLVLQVTEILRRFEVVGKFVEFYGPGASSLSVPDRATLSNMAPEYGATIGFFAADEATAQYLLDTGRDANAVAAMRTYLYSQGLFGIPQLDQIDYSAVVKVNLKEVNRTVAGPRRPQDRIPLAMVGQRFNELFEKPVSEGGYGKSHSELKHRFTVNSAINATDTVSSATTVHNQSTDQAATANTVMRNEIEMVEAASKQPPPLNNEPEEKTPHETVRNIGHGDIVIAAITSCTNTSNPWVMCAAGLVAAKAVALGLRVPPWVKTSLAPGSRAVTTYLQNLELLQPLERLGFAVAAYGCTTCIGNSGPLNSAIESAISDHDLVCTSVLSGNRNFEARIHPRVRGNFLMSPPLVVAFALAGRIGIDVTSDPLGVGSNGQAVYLRDIWPTNKEISALLPATRDPQLYLPATSEQPQITWWDHLQSTSGERYKWESSTYIAEPPFLSKTEAEPTTLLPIHAARILALFGDSVTTDHISPAGAIAVDSPAGLWLQEQGVAPNAFNSYGARRGNHHVMVRGTFANPRIFNRMMVVNDSQVVGGYTLLQPTGERMTIFSAAQHYINDNIPSVIFAGKEYGAGSSRDWAAKGTAMLGVRAVIAQSFERIHRSNLIGMGVLPLQFREGDDSDSLGLTGRETIAVNNWEALTPRSLAELVIHRSDGSSNSVPVLLRIDTLIEADYLRHGGILPYALRTILAQAKALKKSTQNILHP